MAAIVAYGLIQRSTYTGSIAPSSRADPSVTGAVGEWPAYSWKPLCR